ncbi:unnamed protein product [Caenorhabditis auriculariae]|uniref:Non-specific serine/threonine protein kinase n=1 Tax=Caenorhabditis auriculariae TaxID=2777116 RepID=A0A8S1HH26_9PELO|nr:unnamed protein product [Caenorhabditis auriculariae]
MAQGASSSQPLEEKWAYYLLTGFMTKECREFVMSSDPEEKKELVGYARANIQTLLDNMGKRPIGDADRGQLIAEMTFSIDFCDRLLFMIDETEEFSADMIKSYMDSCLRALTIQESEAMCIILKPFIISLTMCLKTRDFDRYGRIAVGVISAVSRAMEYRCALKATKSVVKLFPDEIRLKLNGDNHRMNLGYIFAALLGSVRMSDDRPNTRILPVRWTRKQKEILYKAARVAIQVFTLPVLVEEGVAILREMIEVLGDETVAIQSAFLLVDFQLAAARPIRANKSLSKEFTECFQAINNVCEEYYTGQYQTTEGSETLFTLLDRIFTILDNNEEKTELEPVEEMWEAMLSQLQFLPLFCTEHVAGLSLARWSHYSRICKDLIEIRLAKYTMSREGLAMLPCLAPYVDILFYFTARMNVPPEEMSKWIETIIGDGKFLPEIAPELYDARIERAFFIRTAMMLVFNKCAHHMRADYLKLFMPTQQTLWQMITSCRSRADVSDKQKLERMIWYYYAVSIAAIESPTDLRGWVTILSLPWITKVKAPSQSFITDIRFHIGPDEPKSYIQLTREAFVLDSVMDNYVRSLTLQSICFLNATTDVRWVSEVIRCAINANNREYIETLIPCLPTFVLRNPQYSISFAKGILAQECVQKESVSVLASLTLIADLLCISTGNCSITAKECRECSKSDGYEKNQFASFDPERHFSLEEVRPFLASVFEWAYTCETEESLRMARYLNRKSFFAAVVRFLRVLFIHSSRPSLFRIWKMSYQFIFSPNPTVREEYKSLFELLIKDVSVASVLSSSIRMTFESTYIRRPDKDSIEFAAPFLEMFICEGFDPGNATKSYIRKCIESNPAENTFFPTWFDAKSTLVKIYKIKHRSGVPHRPSETRRRWFMSNCRQVVTDIIAMLRNDPVYISATFKDEIYYKLQKLCFLFDFNSLYMFVNDIKYVLLPRLFMWAPFDQNRAEPILDFIIETFLTTHAERTESHLRALRQKYVLECFPRMFEVLYEVPPDKFIDDFFRSYCDISLDKALAFRRKEVMTVGLLHASFVFFDKDTYWLSLMMMSIYRSKCQSGFEMMEIFRYKNEGMDYFLEFRRSFLADDKLEVRCEIAKSLSFLLQVFDEKFLEESLWIVLSVLRTAPAESKFVLEIYTLILDNISLETLQAYIMRILIDLERLGNGADPRYNIILQRFESLIYPVETTPELKKIAWPMISAATDKMLSEKHTSYSPLDFSTGLDLLRNYSRLPVKSLGIRMREYNEKEIYTKKQTVQLTKAILPLVNQNLGREMNAVRLIPEFGILDPEEIDLDYVRWDRKHEEYYVNPSKMNDGVFMEIAIFAENYTVSPTTDAYEYLEKVLYDLHASPRNIKTLDTLDRKMLEGLKLCYGRSSKRKDLPMVVVNRPFIEYVRDYYTWMLQIFMFCIRDCDTAMLPLRCVPYIYDIYLCAKLLPKVVLHYISTRPEKDHASLIDEFRCLLKRAIYPVASKWITTYAVQSIFYLFDYLQWAVRPGCLEKNEELIKRIKSFTMKMLEMMDDNGIPLLPVVADGVGQEHRSIQWLELYMENREIDRKQKTIFYFLIQKYYTRVADLNGCRGAATCLMQVEPDHIPGKILLAEFRGDVGIARSLYKLDDTITVASNQEALDRLSATFNALMLQDADQDTQEEKDAKLKAFNVLRECEKRNLDARKFDQKKTLMHNVNSRKDWTRFADLALMYSNFQSRRIDLMKMAANQARESILDEMKTAVLIGSPSYATILPMIVAHNVVSNAEDILESDQSELTNAKSDMWKRIVKRSLRSNHNIEIDDHVNRCRRTVLSIRRDQTPSADYRLDRAVAECYLESAKIWRTAGCYERAFLLMSNAQRLVPYCNQLTIEEAKLELQQDNFKKGLTAIERILETNFSPVLEKFRKMRDVNKKTEARAALQKIPHIEQSLFTSLQKLRIGHIIKSGEATTFDQIREDTAHLLYAFAPHGEMYDVVWYLDFLVHGMAPNRPESCLALMRGYRDVAKHERNQEFADQAVTRLISIWLTVTNNVKLQMDEKKNSATSNNYQTQMRTLDAQISEAVKELGWRVLYAAFPTLVHMIDHRDDEVFNIIKHMMVQLIIRYPHVCLWQSIHLLRGNEQLKTERYKAVLDVVKRKSELYKAIVEQYDFSARVFLDVGEKRKTNEEPLSKRFPQLQTLIRDKKYDPAHIEYGRRKEHDRPSVRFGIMIPIKSYMDSSVNASDMSLKNDSLTENEYTHACNLHDAYRIHQFEEKFTVLSSKTAPKVVEFRLGTGESVKIMFKGEDDLTKDFQFMNLMNLCNMLLKNDERTQLLRLTTRSYSVIPLAKFGGVIEFVPGLNNLMGVLEPYLKLTKEIMSFWGKKWGELSLDRKKDFYRDVCCKEIPLVMARWFRDTYPEPGKWFYSRKKFAKSAAVMSMIGFIFGLGDRHARNLMIDARNGMVVHVDFDSIFNVADFTQIAEPVPFRLTRNMIDGMSRVGLEGEFRTVCEQTLLVLREHSYRIDKSMSLLPDLVSGPSLDSCLKRIKSERGKDISYKMKNAIHLVNVRLAGNIVSPLVYREVPLANKMSVEQQVATLIDIATNEDRLAEMYIGWLAAL